MGCNKAGGGGGGGASPSRSSAFNNAAGAPSRAQSDAAFGYKPVRNAQPAIVQNKSDGSVQVSTYSAPSGNGRGKWYQKAIDRAGNTIKNSFKKWSP